MFRSCHAASLAHRRAPTEDCCAGGPAASERGAGGRGREARRGALLGAPRRLVRPEHGAAGVGERGARGAPIHPPPAGGAGVAGQPPLNAAGGAGAAAAVGTLFWRGGGVTDALDALVGAPCLAFWGAHAAGCLPSQQPHCNRTAPCWVLYNRLTPADRGGFTRWLVSPETGCSGRS